MLCGLTVIARQSVCIKLLTAIFAGDSRKLAGGYVKTAVLRLLPSTTALGKMICSLVRFVVT